MTDNRKTIFISHATPDDNEFAVWLSARLSAAGYEVWCDQERLLGGEDFWKDIETVLRTRAVKFVLVISKHIRTESGGIRDGIAKEIAVADAIKKKGADPYFLVPALIDNTPYDEFGIEFIRLNGIDFKTNWAAGLAKLIKVLERDAVPRDEGLVSPSMEAWRKVHKALSRSISENVERLQSNWLELESFPALLRFYDVQIPSSFSEIQTMASDCSLPCVDHGRLLASFASLDEMRTALGPSIPITERGTLPLADFLKGQTGDILGIAPADARRKLSSLVRQAWEVTMCARGLISYEMANKQLAWWFPAGVPEDGQLHYEDVNGKPRRRAVRGIRGKKEAEDGQEVPRYFWHLGFTAAPFISETSHIILKPRLIISDDGKTPLKSKTKLNAIRRAVTKMWFNDKWRGLVLGFASWLAGDGSHIALRAGEAATVRLARQPVDFTLPYGIAADPVSLEEGDEERFEQAETALRLSDPAFADIEDEDEE